MKYTSLTPTSPTFANLTGLKFGALTALSPFKRKTSKRTFWLCRCECGTRTYVQAGNLRTGNTTSCGCKVNAARLRIKHGMCNTRTYRAWNNMRTRCNVASHEGFKNYGGRNITYAKRWNIFANFLADMGVCPPHLELDRINVNGNYNKRNCRWTTRLINQRNKRCHVTTSVQRMRSVQKAPGGSSLQTLK